MKKVHCNACEYEWISKAEDKNIKCPSCKNYKSFGIIEPVPPGAYLKIKNRAKIWRDIIANRKSNPAPQEVKG